MIPQSYPFLTVSKKLPESFTGEGAEIIGHPTHGSGELWYLDGKFHSLNVAI